ncbi:Panacea domain-containing protein [Rhodopseudomonas palustris]|uniref:DUF4065 domain-containing protein n=1 Tax=Rhodopseudomonas palustris TaxID=1076 RepID=A0A418VD66_RHOPL|nr:type II toxin-antitoxin system antitoxin SocA domain-containing protein [Rhodopseudomonas palustris]RJF74089.1 DUF4065 domain-containing protein [Rhodopseudomonas palustris]
MTAQTQATADIHDVVDYIVVKMEDAGERLNVLKLHKLLYYVQAWNLAFGKGRFFNNEFQAWVHGPVCRIIYDRFKDTKSMYSPVRRRDMRENFDVDALPNPVKRHIDNILEAYAEYTDDQLEEMTHQERPWIETREGYHPNERCEKAISDKTMQEYYSARLQRNTAS